MTCLFVAVEMFENKTMTHWKPFRMIDEKCEMSVFPLKWVCIDVLVHGKIFDKVCYWDVTTVSHFATKRYDIPFAFN